MLSVLGNSKYILQNRNNHLPTPKNTKHDKSGTHMCAGVCVVPHVHAWPEHEAITIR